MTNVIDWILDLFRDPIAAQAFIDDPDRSMANAGVQGVTAAQVNAVAATVAPAAVVHGGGNPVHGLQQAVAQTHGIAFVPQPQHEVLSNNDVLSHNDTRLLSPETNVVNAAGEDQQQGVGNVNLDFGDITFGDKNTASDGSVINTGNAGDIDNTNVKGDGNVVGDDNENVNTGDIDDSNVNIGEDNEIDDRDQAAGGDIVQDNEGPVINDTTVGGGGDARGGDGDGGLFGGGDGGNASGGSGGVLIVEDDDTSSTTVDGDQSNVDVGGDVSGGIDASADEDNDVSTTVSDNDVSTTVNDNDTTVNDNDTTVSTTLEGGDVSLF
jgi:hypothetical protein